MRTMRTLRSMGAWFLRTTRMMSDSRSERPRLPGDALEEDLHWTSSRVQPLQGFLELVQLLEHRARVIMRVRARSQLRLRKHRGCFLDSVCVDPPVSENSVIMRRRYARHVGATHCATVARNSSSVRPSDSASAAAWKGVRSGESNLRWKEDSPRRRAHPARRCPTAHDAGSAREMRVSGYAKHAGKRPSSINGLARGALNAAWCKALTRPPTRLSHHVGELAPDYVRPMMYCRVALHWHHTAAVVRVVCSGAGAR